MSGRGGGISPFIGSMSTQGPPVPSAMFPSRPLVRPRIEFTLKKTVGLCALGRPHGIMWRPAVASRSRRSTETPALCHKCPGRQAGTYGLASTALLLP